MKTKLTLIEGAVFLLLLSTFNFQLSTTYAQGTAFTYQGRLSGGGGLANGSYDLAFALYTTNVTGAPIAGPVTNAAVPVTNGLFTTVVDFGNVFTGTSNWLELAVSTNGANQFTTLAPRQALTPTPYAVMAEGAVAGAITTAMLANEAVTGDKISAGAVKGYNIDDGGSGAYASFQKAVQGVGGDTTLTFSNLLQVPTNGLSPSFALTINGSTFGTVVGFSGYEAMSQPYYYVVQVSQPAVVANPDAELGLNAQLTYSRSGLVTSFGGLVTACTLSGSDGASFFYTVRIESPLAYLALKTDYRIYQDTTAPSVASGVYQTLTGYTPTLSLAESYSTHSSLTQYGETSLNFFSRLLENEGVFYFFNQTPAVPGLVLGDSASAYLASPGSPFVYYGDAATNVPAAEYIRTFQRASHQSTLTSTVNSYNFTLPTASLLASTNGAEGVQEYYEFGNDVQTLAYDQQVAAAREDLQTARRMTMTGSATAPDLRAGYTFTLTDQSGAGLGGSYLITSVHHAGFVRVTNGVSAWFYGNEFQAIPTGLTFRPALMAPKPLAEPCTAVVAGPAGQEIYTDKYGRLKVQFHWDRYGANNQNSSAWLRLATPMAGANGRGMLFLPRVGDEVLVSFIEGDPDRPLITGSLYNAANLPPYVLPANSAVSTIRSTGTPSQPTEINEIKFDDTAGSQVLGLQAAKDLSVKAAYDITVQAGNNLTVTAPGTATVTATGNLALQTSGAATVNSAGNLNLLSSGTLNLQGNQTSVTGGMNIDQANQNNGGDSADALTFGAGSGEGIASKRTTGGSQYDLELCTGFLQRMIILNNGNIGIGTSASTAPLDVQGNQSGTFANATVIINNTNNTASSGPALRVQWNGTASGNQSGLAALSVSANNLAGQIAEFGNANTWVATIANDGTVNATAFNTTSDRNAKANFAPVNSEAILARVAALPISEWNFKTDPADQKHLGPMAQDFHAAFGLNGADDKHISVVDEGGVALAAIQGLNQKLDEKDSEIQTLKQQNEALEKRLDYLENAVKSLTAKN